MPLIIKETIVSGTIGNVRGDDNPGTVTSWALANIIPSVVEGVAWSIDIEFYDETVDTATTLVTRTNASSVTTTYDFSEFGITMTKPNAYTVRLTGPASNVFPNTYYQFRMPDGSLKVLPPDTTETFVGLVKYNMPSPTSTSKSYDFVVTIPANNTLVPPLLTYTQTVTMTQNFYWTFETAVANVKALVARGQK